MGTQLNFKKGSGVLRGNNRHSVLITPRGMKQCNPTTARGNLPDNSSKLSYLQDQGGLLWLSLLAYYSTNSALIVINDDCFHD